jgi:hypothetical protein
MGQIAALLDKARSADEPDLDIPAEIARRQDRLNAIAQARARLEQPQRDADLERGRSDHDDRRPKGKDGKTKGGRYKREFGTPENSAHDNFTDPDSRIMKRAGGGYDASYNAQTAVDVTAHIIVAAELTDNASDAGELPTMLHPDKNNLGQTPEQALADTGYRSEAVFEQLADSGTDPVVASGREGKQRLGFDPARKPHTARMADKLQSPDGKAAYGDACGSPSRPTAG